MAKRYITSLLSEKLGKYLDGLDSTDIKFGLSEAILQLENVTFKEDALTKLKLPVQIKHGLIHKLDVRIFNFTHLGSGSLAKHRFFCSIDSV